MALRYLAILSPDPGGGYTVSFPDCPGCLTEGRTFDEAIDAATEALELWVEDMRDEGHEIAPPSGPMDIVSKTRKGDVLIPIVAPSPPAKAVPVTITVRQDLLERIDAGARAKGQTRSAFMAEASATAAASVSTSISLAPTVAPKFKAKAKR